MTDRLPIRWRLTLWYVAILALALVLFSGALYFGLRQLLYESLDDTLESQFALIAATIEVEDGGLDVEAGQLDVVEEDEVFVLLLDRDGSILLDTRENEDEPSTRALLTGWRRAAEGRADLRWIGDGDSQQFRVLTRPVTTGGEIAGAVQVGVSDEGLAETLDFVLTLLMILGPLMLIAASAGGVWLAGRALAPVVRITHLAGEIESRDLSRRIRLALPNDEIGRLARTFNAMLDRLEAAFRRQRQFTADASHELRTPLAMMQSQIELALRQPRDAQEDQAILESLAGDIDRLTRISTALLMLARDDIRRIEVSRDDVDLPALLDLMAEQYGPIAREYGVEIVVESEPARLTADEDRLIQLLVNLLDNALRHTPPGKRIMLGCRSEDSHVRLWVADQGIGIPPEHLPHLFERFYRVDQGRDRQRGGIGLGLSISRAIVDLHGGTIEVASTPGEGTTMTITLPRDLPPDPPAGGAARARGDVRSMSRR